MLCTLPPRQRKRTKGASTSQPRATPWVSMEIEQSPERAKQRCATRSICPALAGLVFLATRTQGAALGWLVQGLWPTLAGNQYRSGTNHILLWLVDWFCRVRACHAFSPRSQAALGNALARPSTFPLLSPPPPRRAKLCFAGRGCPRVGAGTGSAPADAPSARSETSPKRHSQVQLGNEVQSEVKGITVFFLVLFHSIERFDTAHQMTPERFDKNRYLGAEPRREFFLLESVQGHMMLRRDANPLP